ncbi:hypothetical protein V6615_06550 [Oscillospiraceae bacterium PP1C4]
MKRILALLLTVALSSALFLSLYHFDNKYTKAAPQAVNGVLYVMEADWANTPVRFLREGWRYYANRLLTPETLQQEDYRYLSLGEQTNFAMGDSLRSPHGSASYALTLNLPQTEHTYAIDLPEIYSAYRFYVNDKLKLQMGEPNLEKYRDQTQNRVVTFEASGGVTLLLTVSDQSWIQSGLTRLPAFGEQPNIYTHRGLRFGISLIVVIATLLLALFSFYLAIRTHNRNNSRLFFLLYLATAVSASYSAVHGIMPLPIQPWQTIEVVSGHLVTLFVILLHNRICETNRYAQGISGVLAGVVSVLGLFYGAFAAQLTQPVIIAFSALAKSFKLLTAVYL